MSKLRQVLKLYSQGKSKLFISRYLDLSRNTVDKYILHFQLLNKPIDEVIAMDDLGLEALFISKPAPRLTQKQKELYAFFPHMEKRLKKTGITKAMLWKEYIEKHPDGYMSSQFCEYYNRWIKRASPVMHINHKAGDKMYVDYAGKTLELVDKDTGEIIVLQFFVAVLGASQYTYAEASPSQGKEDFIRSVENALHFFGGVPEAIVPDNLKSAVTKSNRYEPTINETFLDFADHYNTTVLPARAYKPRDKSLAEGAVKILYTRIYSEINKHTYHSIQEINAAIWEALDRHNRHRLSGRTYSRSDLFYELEKKELGSLPQNRYEVKKQLKVTVSINGHVHVSVDRNYYSVPYQYIRKKVKILYTSEWVEIYYKYNRIAAHRRSTKPFNYTTLPDHMASTHRFVTEWTPQRFIDNAAKVGEPVRQLIINILERKQHPEQAYKSCMGVLSLEKKVGKERLNSACERALEFNIHNYKIVQNILEKGLDQVDHNEDNDQHLPDHYNIRGKRYYK